MSVNNGYTIESIVSMSNETFDKFLEEILSKRNPQDILRHRLDTAEFSSATKRLLWRNGYETYGEILEYTEEEFIKCNGIGVVALEDIKRGLKIKGLKFKEPNN